MKGAQSPQECVTSLYHVISGPAEQDRNWDQLRKLFDPEARIRVALVKPDGSEEEGDWSVEDFIGLAKEEYRTAGFWEREVASEVVEYGNIAHSFSTYETRVGAIDREPMGRGINSVQLLRRDGDWKIVSLVFAIEQPDQPIPERYLA